MEVTDAAIDITTITTDAAPPPQWAPGNLSVRKEYDLAKVLCILGYVHRRTKLLPASNLSQEDQLILDWMVHLFLLATNLWKVDSVFMEAIGLRNITDPEMKSIVRFLAEYTVGKNHVEVGNNNRVYHDNAPANLPPTQDGFSLAQQSRYTFPQAEPPFRNQQYDDGFSLAQQYRYTFPQAEPPFRNQQYDGNSMRISTAGQFSGLSNLGHQFSNPRYREFSHS